MQIDEPKHLINAHAHHRHPRDFEEHLAEWTAQGATLTCVACGSREWHEAGIPIYTNEDLAPWVERYPDRVIGLAFVETAGTPDGADAVQRWHDRGFRGLKIICPDAPYDDPKYFAIYERAQALRMPILFHTGYVSSGDVGSGLYTRTNCEHMRPWRLERVARCFPDLRILGAHLGKPHEPEALCLIQQYPNVYFDFTGGGGSRRWQEAVLRTLMPRPGADLTDPDQHPALYHFRKLCFGTDNPPLSRWRPAAKCILDALAIPADLREEYYWRNAARLFDLKHLLAE